MGARDAFVTLQPRGLSTEDALRYLGIKRRAFDTLKVQLRPIRIGTSKLYDVRELDQLFDRLKGQQSAGDDIAGQELHQSSKEAESTLDRRPVSEKGEKPWVVKAASTKTPKVGGESTASTAVSAFRAVSTRIKTRKPG
jgi:hypothetical protein